MTVATWMLITAVSSGTCLSRSLMIQFSRYLSGECCHYLYTIILETQSEHNRTFDASQTRLSYNT